MKWLKRRQRDRRGLEIQHLVPEMLRYVADRYEPQIKYSIGPIPAHQNYTASHRFLTRRSPPFRT